MELLLCESLVGEDSHGIGKDIKKEELHEGKFPTAGLFFGNGYCGKTL